MPPATKKRVSKKRSVAKRSSKSVKPKKAVIPKRVTNIRKQVKSIVSDCKGVCSVQEKQLRNLTEQTIRSLKEDHDNRVRILQQEMNELRRLGDSSEIKKELSVLQQELKSERENVARQLTEAVENANRIHSENLKKIQSDHSSELSKQSKYCDEMKKELQDKLVESVNNLKQLEQNLKEIRGRKEDLKREIAELRSNTANSDEINRLKAELAQEKQDMLSVQSFIETYRQEISELKSQRDELQKEHSECKSAQDTLRNELATIQERMKNECQDSKEEMRRQFEDEKVALNKTIADLKAVKSSVPSAGPPIGAGGPPLALMGNTANQIVSADPRSSLLSSIKAGKQLRKVDQKPKLLLKNDSYLGQELAKKFQNVKGNDDNDNNNNDWDFRSRRSRKSKKSKKSRKLKKSKKSLRRKH